MNRLILGGGVLACHPERSEGSLRPSSQTHGSRSEPALAEALERSEGVTGLISKCLGGGEHFTRMEYSYAIINENARLSL